MELKFWHDSKSVRSSQIFTQFYLAEGTLQCLGIENRIPLRFYALNDVISQQKRHLVGIYPTLRNPCEARQRNEWQEEKYLHFWEVENMTGSLIFKSTVPLCLTKILYFDLKPARCGLQWWSGIRLKDEDQHFCLFSNHVFVSEPGDF